MDQLKKFIFLIENNFYKENMSYYEKAEVLKSVETKML